MCAAPHSQATSATIPVDQQFGTNSEQLIWPRPSGSPGSPSPEPSFLPHSDASFVFVRSALQEVLTAAAWLVCFIDAASVIIHLHHLLILDAEENDVKPKHLLPFRASSQRELKNAPSWIRFIFFFVPFDCCLYF